MTSSSMNPTPCFSRSAGSLPFPRPVTLTLLTCLTLVAFAGEPAPAPSPSPYARWTRGPSRDADFFPIAVWLQSPAKARRYLDAGFNTYVGLWKGPTDEQLATLKSAGMKIICDQNDVGLRHLDDPTIIGWMHGDEPDNAQPKPGGGYGPPIPPEDIVRDYGRIRAADPSRPVLLNLGQGVAWDAWHGRGVRSNHPEDYPEYVKGGDIVSFDIYPVTHPSPAVTGKLSYVGRGVERLVGWSDGRVVWNCIECTRISSKTTKPTPAQVRSEVWMALIHGSRGIIYFVHEWEPKFNESALLDDAEMLAAVSELNREIARLAPVLNSPTLRDAVNVEPDPAGKIATMVKQTSQGAYLFAVEMRGEPTKARFQIENAPRTVASVNVEGTDRTIPLSDSAFNDTFAPWEARIYRLSRPAESALRP